MLFSPSAELEKPKRRNAVREIFYANNKSSATFESISWHLIGKRSRSKTNLSIFGFFWRFKLKNGRSGKRYVNLVECENVERAKTIRKEKMPFGVLTCGNSFRLRFRKRRCVEARSSKSKSEARASKRAVERRLEPIKSIRSRRRRRTEMNVRHQMCILCTLFIRFISLRTWSASPLSALECPALYSLFARSTSRSHSRLSLFYCRRYQHEIE